MADGDRDVLEGAATLAQLNPLCPVRTDAVAFVVGTLFQQAGTYECRLVAQRPDGEGVAVHLCRGVASLCRVPGQRFCPVAIDDVGTWHPAEHLLQGVRGIQRVARIKEQGVFALGVSDALVHGIEDAAVPLRAAPCRFRLKLGEEVLAAVGASSVHDNPFEVPERLRADAVASPAQTGDVVVTDGDDAESLHARCCFFCRYLL